MENIENIEIVKKSRGRPRKERLEAVKKEPVIKIDSKLKQKCDCGGIFTTYTINRHIKTKKHQKFLGNEVEDTKRARPTSEKTRILNSLVCNLTAEELVVKREYFAETSRQYRLRKNLI
jgi:hypothetical protein